jgi:hypothetical protein
VSIELIGLVRPVEKQEAEGRLLLSCLHCILGRLPLLRPRSSPSLPMIPCRSLPNSSRVKW